MHCLLLAGWPVQTPLRPVRSIESFLWPVLSHRRRQQLPFKAFGMRNHEPRTGSFENGSEICNCTWTTGAIKELCMKSRAAAFNEFLVTGPRKCGPALAGRRPVATRRGLILGTIGLLLFSFACTTLGHKSDREPLAES